MFFFFSILQTLSRTYKNTSTHRQMSILIINTSPSVTRPNISSSLSQLSTTYRQSALRLFPSDAQQPPPPHYLRQGRGWKRGWITPTSFTYATQGYWKLMEKLPALYVNRKHFQQCRDNTCQPINFNAALLNCARSVLKLVNIYFTTVEISLQNTFPLF